jgi:hypothetical protein
MMTLTPSLIPAAHRAAPNRISRTGGSSSG